MFVKEKEGFFTFSSFFPHFLSHRGNCNTHRHQRGLKRWLRYKPICRQRDFLITTSGSNHVAQNQTWKTLHFVSDVWDRLCKNTSNRARRRPPSRPPRSGLSVAFPSSISHCFARLHSKQRDQQDAAQTGRAQTGGDWETWEAFLAMRCGRTLSAA